MKSLRVVLVDDDPLILDLIEELLVDLPLQTIRANGASQAMDVVMQHEPHLIITDTNMPNGSGIDLIQETRRRGFETPIVIFFNIYKLNPRLTSQHLIEMGANFVLSKCGMHDSLKPLVSHLLGLRQLP